MKAGNTQGTVPFQIAFIAQYVPEKDNKRRFFGYTHSEGK